MAQLESGGTTWHNASPTNPSPGPAQPTSAVQPPAKTQNANGLTPDLSALARARKEGNKRSAMCATEPLFELGEPHPTEPGYLPAWITEQLKANRKPTYRRAAAFTRCPRCKQIILTGLDDDWCAFNVQADPTPINDHQESACATIKRPTYAADISRRNIELDRRPFLAHGKPSSSPILPGHRCGARFPTFLYPPESITPGATNEPPF